MQSNCSDVTYVLQQNNRYCGITSAAACLIVKDTMAESKVENVGFKQPRKVTERRYRLPAQKHYVYASFRETPDRV